MSNSDRLKTLKVLAVFTLGSSVGLVTLSHFLGYLLKHFKKMTTALIIGFITGSLGVLWPWKQTIFKTNEMGEYVLDSNNDLVILNYKRYWPNVFDMETWAAFFFILFGIFIVLSLDWYGQNRKA